LELRSKTLTVDIAYTIYVIVVYVEILIVKRLVDFVIFSSTSVSIGISVSVCFSIIRTSIRIVIGIGRQVGLLIIGAELIISAYSASTQQQAIDGKHLKIDDELIKKLSFTYRILPQNTKNMAVASISVRH
jgi:hypothetical protein